MIDIHSHLLPGIDDGADDLATAVAMCRLAAADGCEAIVATPHQRTTHWENADLGRLAALRDEVARAAGGAIEIHLGGEVRVDADFLAELAAGDGTHGPAPLAGSRYLLLELDRHHLRIDPEELVHELVVGDWRPIFAHPEFIPALAGDLDRVGELAAAGALFQITAMSLTGDFGRTARQVCHDLLDRGLVHFVASDCHGVGHRPPGLSRARRVLAERWGEETATRLTGDNPRAVIEDRPVAAGTPAPAAPARQLAR
ncbi:MAG TPA: CpsB/CapC family capsule biosynthesis tyrosine phosphatase [Thermoanaerobaculia bacterium]